MIKIPVENLGLFEQLDRIVVAFFRKQQPSSPYNLNIKSKIKDIHVKWISFTLFHHSLSNFFCSDSCEVTT